MRIAPILGFTLAVVALGLLGRAADPTTQPAAADASPLVGKPAPDFALPGLDGGSHSLADGKGHVLVLDFWGTWCVPCHEALPHVDALYHDQSAKGLMVFAIDNGDEKAAVQKFVSDTKLTLPVLLDPDSKGSDAYKVDQYPQTVVIGKDGLVKNVFIGFKPSSTPADLERAVAAAMAQAN